MNYKLNYKGITATIALILQRFDNFLKVVKSLPQQ